MTRTQARVRALALMLFMAAAVALYAFFFTLAGVDLPGSDDRYRVEAVVPTALSLAQHADVRQAGVTVGRVTALRGTGDVTVLELELDDDHAPVYRNARLLVRAKTAVGENYVDLEPGRPAAGAVPNGGRLPVERAREATQVDEILSVFDRRGRRDLQRLLDGLGGGLEGHGDDLNRLLEASAAITREGDPAVAILDAERGQVARLVDSFGRVTRALGERREAIRLLVRRTKVAAGAVAAREAYLRDTLAELPPFLSQVRATTTRLGRVAGAATPVMRDLRLATGDLVPLMRELRPAAARGRAVMRELDRFAGAATPALVRLRPFARAADEFVPPLAAVLRQYNPLAAYVAPYARDLSAFFATVGASTDFTDEVGHLGRVVPFMTESGAPGTLSEEERELYDSALQSFGGGFEPHGMNPYPAPGAAATPSPFEGDYPRLTAEPPYGTKAARARTK